jgi:hypothetical protein
VVFGNHVVHTKHLDLISFFIGILRHHGIRNLRFIRILYHKMTRVSAPSKRKEASQ